MPAVKPDDRAIRERAWDLAVPLIVFALTAAAIRSSEDVLGPLAAILASGLGRPGLLDPADPARSLRTDGRRGLAGERVDRRDQRPRALQERNFFGVLQVTDDPRSHSHRLFHGRTLHGQQSLDPARRREPLSYFHRSGPIGQVFDAFHARPASASLPRASRSSASEPAPWHATPSPAERWTFYEIDPAVVRIASDPRDFTFLDDCRAEALEIILGDARLKIREAPDHRYDLIILDAFSSDAIPMHLLTREALRLYRRKLAGQGVLAVHISNRSFDLEAIVEALARDAGLVCRIRTDRKVTPEDARAGKQGSIWAVMAASDSDLGTLATDPRWVRPPQRGGPVWTDDFSSIAGQIILKAR